MLGFLKRLLLLALTVSVGSALGRAMTVVEPSLGKLVGASEQVLRIEVLEQRCVDDITPSGRNLIHTYVRCRVVESFKGNGGEEIELRFLGGNVGAQRLEVPGMPLPQIGHAYVVFLKGNGRAFCPVSFAQYGCYLISRNPADGSESLSHHDGAALGTLALPQDESALAALPAGKLPGMSPDAFGKLIRRIENLSHSTDAH